MKPGNLLGFLWEKEDTGRQRPSLGGHIMIRTWHFSMLAVLWASTSFALPFQFVQEGLVQTQDDRPLQGNHRVDITLRQKDGDRLFLFFRKRTWLSLLNGYYAILIGSEDTLELDMLMGDGLFLGVSIDEGDELTPRRPVVNVPSAMVAEVAKDVQGTINPNQIRINGQVVIDENGQWVSDPTGLQGPPGEPGGDGSADTPTQILDKLVQVDGDGSLLDADLLDGAPSESLYADRPRHWHDGQSPYGPNTLCRNQVPRDALNLRMTGEPVMALY